MRRFGKMFVLASLAFAAATVAGGQPPGFQPGIFGGKGKADYFSLIQNPQVKEALKVTDQQSDKLPAAALKALAEVLDGKQIARLKEIYLQQRGDAAYLEAEAKTQLKITDAQAAKIKAALDT